MAIERVAIVGMGTTMGGDMRFSGIRKHKGLSSGCAKIAMGCMLLVLGGCMARYPSTRPISSVESLEPFFLKATSENGKSSDLLFILTFSGGGTRAAAFSYGVLKALSEIQVSFDLLEDEGEREHLKGLPTSFRLGEGDVDRLIAAAKTILENSIELRSLIHDLR